MNPPEEEKSRLLTRELVEDVIDILRVAEGEMLTIARIDERARQIVTMLLGCYDVKAKHISVADVIPFLTEVP